MPDSRPSGGPPAHLSPSQRLLDDWPGAGIVGPCPSPAPANGMQPLREEGEAGPQAPSPAAGFKPKWECYAAVCVCGREPLHPSTLPACHPPSLSLSSNSCSLAVPLWQSGSLAALVPDPCVARSLVSNLPGPPKPSQTSPPSAAPSFPCPPGGSTRLHAGHQGIYLHRQRLATEQDEALAWALACAHEHTRETS